MNTVAYIIYILYDEEHAYEEASWHYELPAKYLEACFGN